MVRHAVVGGAGAAFGAEIAARLAADGFAVTAIAGGDVTPAELPPVIDALILNAPVTPDVLRFADVGVDDFRRALTAQLLAPVAAIQAAVPRMTRGGAIVHIASTAHLGAWGGVHQMAAGGALVGLNRSVALEFGDRGIRANVLAPDFAGADCDTPAARAALAAAAAWLAGSDSALVSGEVLIADEARCLKLAQSVRR